MSRILLADTSRRIYGGVDLAKCCSGFLRCSHSKKWQRFGDMIVKRPERGNVPLIYARCTTFSLTNATRALDRICELQGSDDAIYSAGGRLIIAPSRNRAPGVLGGTMLHWTVFRRIELYRSFVHAFAQPFLRAARGRDVDYALVQFTTRFEARRYS